MISFKPLDAALYEDFLKTDPQNDAFAFVRSYLEFLLGEEDAPVRVCLFDGCFLSRRELDVGYEFTLPYPYLPTADEEGALEALEEYARRHEIPLVFCDIQKEDIDMLNDRYRFTRTEQFEEEESGECFYRLTVLTECTECDELPTLQGKRLTLTHLTEEDKESYALLCRDEDILALWGYDYREDAPNADADYFLRIAKEDFLSGRSMTFAIKDGDRFVGELILYAFDGRGRAEFSVRILAGYRRKGYAREAVLMLFDYAKELGLKTLDAVCLTKNHPSVALLTSVMRRKKESDGMIFFQRNLE